MSIVIHVPATLANLGSGYDTLGCAISIGNRFEIAQGGSPGGLVWETAHAAGVHFGFPCPPFTVRCDESVPRSRGMGSSATARVAGLLAWQTLTGQSPDAHEAAHLLARAEGHPDNVWPALLGGLIVCGRVPRPAPVHPGLRIVLCVPEHEVPTPEARAALPRTVPHADAVANLQALGTLLLGLATAGSDALREGVIDRLHQPYRAALIGELGPAFDTVLDLGGAPFISGSGSTIAALVGPDVDPHPIGAALMGAFPGGQPVVHVVSPQPHGARVERA